MIIQWVSLTIWWSGDHSLMNILHTRGRHLWALWDMSTFDKINDGSISIIFQWSAISSLPFSKPALRACWNLSQLSLCQGKYSDLTLFTWWKKLQRLLEQIYCWSILNATQNATAKLCRWSPKTSSLEKLRTGSEGNNFALLANSDSHQNPFGVFDKKRISSSSSLKDNE